MSLDEFAKQFRFDAIPAGEHRQHLPAAVAARLPEQDVIVFPVDDEHSDTASFSAQYGFSLDDCANTLVLKYTKEGVDQYAAVVGLGSRRLDVNGAVKDALGARRLSFARREVATELTGMEFGGITAFGLPDGMRILIDQAVMEREFVVMGAGYRRTKILLATSALAALADAQVAPLALP
jgi:prolyl-tRNA editing enzyme YbaK/EbsC (Cys-tRNA(Pro) deacylase)